MIFLPIFTAIFLLAGLAKVFKTRSPAHVEEVPEFSVARYRPMLRLLDGAESELIAAGERRRFQAERRSIFRGYLRELKADHGRILGGIRSLLVESEIDRPDLAIALYRCQWMFSLAMISIRYRLLLHATGLGAVDVKSLVAAVEGLQCQLQDMKFVQAVGSY